MGLNWSLGGCARPRSLKQYFTEMFLCQCMLHTTGLPKRRFSGVFNNLLTVMRTPVFVYALL
jgi:hypothetical protein